MRWNPYINGLVAVAYARLHHDTPDNLIGSIAALSLFVCSAAVMVFLFFYRPAMLLIEKKHTEAVPFFLKTLGVFAGLTLLAVLTLV
jgi:hypothetical protein